MLGLKRFEKFLLINEIPLKTMQDYTEWRAYNTYFNHMPIQTAYFASTLDTKYPEMEYYPSKKHMSRSSSIHWGQLKLLICEVEFIAAVYRAFGTDMIKESICVYAGSAAGTHIRALSMMFPDLMFHLWDPSSFDSALVRYSILHPKRVKIFKTIMTDQSAARYKGKKIIFMSDVRRTSSGGFDDQSDLLKHEDHLLQKQWIEQMEPYASMLKFSPPYATTKAVPDIDNYQYFDGLNTMQAFAPESSTESRIIFFGTAMRKYDIAKYERQFMYHNVVTRSILLTREQMSVFPTIMNNTPETFEIDLEDIIDKLGAVASYDNWRFIQTYFHAYLTIKSPKNKGAIDPNSPDIIIRHGYKVTPTGFVDWFKKEIDNIEKVLGFTFNQIYTNRKGKRLD